MMKKLMLTAAIAVVILVVLCIPVKSQLYNIYASKAALDSQKAISPNYTRTDSIKVQKHVDAFTGVANRTVNSGKKGHVSPYMNLMGGQ